MMDFFSKGYTTGTHRLMAPEQTLTNIEPHLAAMSISRCADITGLDRIGIPVYCAIRPRSRTVQVSNGKGLLHINAKVSALMEAIEIFHMENPSGRLRRDSLTSMRRNGQCIVQPSFLLNYQAEKFFTEDFLIDWLSAENLLTGEEVWIPGSAVYLCSPMLYKYSSNGLASGNHLIEATLHGLYEVIERDAISRLSVNGRINLSGECCKFIDLNTIDDSSVQELYDLLKRAESKLVLIWVKSCIQIHTFWAVILDQNYFSSSTMINIGYGSHLNISVAAIRAITEAAQVRLTYIHGAREDIPASAYQATESRRKVYAYFDQIEGDTHWQTCSELATEGDDLLYDYTHILNLLSEAGYKNIFRVNLTRSPFNIPVSKVFIPGLKLNSHLF